MWWLCFYSLLVLPPRLCKNTDHYKKVTPRENKQTKLWPIIDCDLWESHTYVCCWGILYVGSEWIYWSNSANSTHKASITKICNYSISFFDYHDKYMVIYTRIIFWHSRVPRVENAICFVNLIFLCANGCKMSPYANYYNCNYDEYLLQLLTHGGISARTKKAAR